MSAAICGSNPCSWLQDALLSQSAPPSALPLLVFAGSTPSLVQMLSSLVLQAQDTTAESAGHSMQQAGAQQKRNFRAEASQWGTNAHTLVSVTGAVLYAQGLWGLW